MSPELKFPSNFLWGSTTSSYQVEGNINNSDWSQDFPAGQTCNHYQFYGQDFDLAKDLNQNAHRFSIEWSRIEPAPGQFDKKEIEHYRQVLLALKSRGIKTMLTLHHFTNPQWLAEIGGWTNPKVIFCFSRFAKKVFQEYQDLVDFWVTINEPLVYTSLSFLQGRWPPQKRNPILFLKVIKNQIQAHKKIYHLFHRIKSGVQVGLVKNNSFIEPFSQSLLDKLAAQTAHYFINRFFLNKTKNHLDFIGLNYYFHSKVKFPGQIKNDNEIVTDMGWEVYPQGIYYALKDLKNYNLPIYITENGLADKQDKLRKDFIEKHLFWVYQAIQEKVDVKGYFHWSLMDNFEWADGFGPCFGLIEINYQSLARKIRPSAWDYAKICKENQLTI